MKRDHLVELRLLELGLHRDGGRLKNFRRVRANHVDADDLVRLAVDDELVERSLITAGEDVLAEVKSSWCCLDAETLRPSRIAQDVAARFFTAG